jgi:hypothetical protein
MSIWWRLFGKMSWINIMHKGEINMTDTDLIRLLIHPDAVPEASQLAYKAGYYEGYILSLMARFPEVREDVKERITSRIN